MDVHSQVVAYYFIQMQRTSGKETLYAFRAIPEKARSINAIYVRRRVDANCFIRMPKTIGKETHYVNRVIQYKDRFAKAKRSAPRNAGNMRMM